jgi:DNA-binding NarL/FixJ family response regulator
MKVLVIEDSPPLRERILRLLRAEPRLTVVGVASTNAEAMALFDALRPELVTLDVSLPDGITLETLKRMRAREPAPTVIVLTGHVQPHYRDRYLKAGAREFVSKLDLEQLPEIIAAILEEA